VYYEADSPYLAGTTYDHGARHRHRPGHHQFVRGHCRRRCAPGATRPKRPAWISRSVGHRRAWSTHLRPDRTSPGRPQRRAHGHGTQTTARHAVRSSAGAAARRYGCLSDPPRPCGRAAGSSPQRTVFGRRVGSSDAARPQAICGGVSRPARQPSRPHRTARVFRCPADCPSGCGASGRTRGDADHCGPYRGSPGPWHRHK
jgi:hypothetical protein